MSCASEKHRVGHAKRHVIQLLAACLYNLDFQSLRTASMYQGPLKSLCVPGLHCYSCPGAIGACPIGSLQGALASSGRAFPFYVVGLLLAFGALLGRSVCGWLCPFGALQGLIHRIPSPKLAKGQWSRRLSWAKYAMLAIVLAGPLVSLAIGGTPVPAFCSFICPAGTLEAGIPLLIGRQELRIMAGPLFGWKLALLVAVLAACIFIYRPFCRFLCPLGALYSFFNRFALLRWTVNESSCTHCGNCIAICPVDIREVSDRECIQCGRCVDACPEHAIGFSLSQLREPRTNAPGKGAAADSLSPGRQDAGNSVPCTRPVGEKAQIDSAPTGNENNPKVAPFASCATLPNSTSHNRPLELPSTPSDEGTVSPDITIPQ